MTAARPATRPACRIKCCGLMRPEDVAAVNRAMPDYAGFIVSFPTSHRSLTPAQAAPLAAGLDAGIRPVAVFVDRPAREVAAAAAEIGAWAVQLHGSEDEAYLAQLRTLTDCRIWQAFKVRSDADLARAAASSADLLLLDSGAGTGRTFDWDLAARFAREFDRPFLLAGGLTPENIPQAIERVHPFGVDISSGIETGKRKDPAKIAAAVAAAHGANGEAAATHHGAATGPWRPDGYA
jgi:phosphoribosylanthranilate isomerase